MKPEAVSLAKITQPSFSGVFQRKRLFALLDRCRKKPVIWVCGPPGAGKTILISSFLETRCLPHIWYQIDDNDEDIATFFYYMGIAAKQAAPRYQKPLPNLTPEYLSGLSTFTRNYFCELFSRLYSASFRNNSTVSSFKKWGIISSIPSFTKGGLGRIRKNRFIIVFDNYHNVRTDALLHEVIRESIEAIPEEANIIFISRTEPPKAFADMQANGLIEIIGWKDLSLTPEEYTGIVRLKIKDKRPHPLNREAEELAYEAYNKTKGWAAGLALMLEAIEKGGFDDKKLKSIGTDAVFAYFASEVLDRLDEDTRNFLLKSAILPVMNPQMTGQLADISNAGKILSDLNKNNYFTEKHSDTKPVYQYHPLFREFLLTRARDSFGDEGFSMLQKKAGLILYEAGRLEDAFSLFRDCSEWGGIARLVMEHASELIKQGRGKVLEEWIASLPEHVLNTYPWLFYWRGICHMPYNPSQSRICLEKAYRIFKYNGEYTGLLRTWCAIIETFIYEWANFRPMVPWLEEMERVLSDNPNLAPELEGDVACSMFMGLMYSQPQRPNMSFWADRVWQIVRGSQDMLLCAKIAPHLILYHTWWCADLPKAEVMLKALRPSIDRMNVPPLARITWYVMSASFYWMIAATDRCIASVDKGLALANETGVHIWDMFLCATGVFATLFNDNADSAEPYFQKMEETLVHSRTLDAGWLYYLNAPRYFFRNEIAKAREYIHLALTMFENGGWIWAVPHVWIDYSIVLFYEGRRDEAIDMVRKARDKNMTLYLSPTHEILSYLMEAEFALLEGNEEACLNSLRPCMAIGRHYKLFYWPWWRSEIMTRLCAKALEHNIEPDYVHELIKKRNLFSACQPVDIENWPWKVKVFTLGCFGLVKDGKQVNFPRKTQHRPLEMLKALIACGGRNITEELLIDILWPDADGDSGHKAFKTTLHRLRSLIGTNAVSYSDRRVTLNSSFFWADIWAFERLLSYAEKALKEGNKEKAIDMIGKAIAMHHGGFLAGDANEPWLAPVRERLKSKFLRYTEKLCRLYEEKGEFGKAIDLLKRGIETDILSEEFYQRLMFCYLRLGRSAEALSVYNSLKKIFISHEVKPSPKTEEIYRSIIGR